jgi:hypothetical protein
MLVGLLPQSLLQHGFLIIFCGEKFLFLYLIE